MYITVHTAVELIFNGFGSIREASWGNKLPMHPEASPPLPKCTNMRRRERKYLIYGVLYKTLRYDSTEDYYTNL